MRGEGEVRVTVHGSRKEAEADSWTGIGGFAVHPDALLRAAGSGSAFLREGLNGWCGWG